MASGYHTGQNNSRGHFLLERDPQSHCPDAEFSPQEGEALMKRNQVQRPPHILINKETHLVQICFLTCGTEGTCTTNVFATGEEGVPVETLEPCLLGHGEGGNDSPRLPYSLGSHHLPYGFLEDSVSLLSLSK